MWNNRARQESDIERPGVSEDKTVERPTERAGVSDSIQGLPPDFDGVARNPARVKVQNRLERLAARAGLNFDRAAAAYHEAGHAVAGLWYGWVIGRNGVEIDQQQRCSFGCAAFAYTIEARAVVAMLGWLSERKWHRQGTGNWDDELIHILDAHAWGQIAVGSDEQELVKALVGRRDPDEVETDEFLLAIRAFREHAVALLSYPHFWRAVRKVTRALLLSGKLSDTAVVNAIGKEDFLRVSHGRWSEGSLKAPRPETLSD
jgi:hypothetical protein